MNIPKPLIRLCKVIVIAAAIPLVPYGLGLFWRFIFILFNWWDDDVFHIYGDYDAEYKILTLWVMGIVVTLVLGLTILGLYCLIKWIITGEDDSDDDSGSGGGNYDSDASSFYLALGGMDMNPTTPY